MGSGRYNIPGEQTREFLALRWRTVRKEDVLVIHLAGELTTADAADVDAELRVVQATDAAQIIIDLTQLQSVDEGALHLINSRRSCTRFRFTGDDGLPVTEPT